MKYILLLVSLLAQSSTIIHAMGKGISISPLLEYLTKDTNLYLPPTPVIINPNDDDDDDTNTDNQTKKQSNASSDLQSELNSIVDRAKQESYLPASSKQHIILDTMPQAMLESLKKEGAPLWNNSTTDGIKTIYINNETIDQLSMQQREALLAHEVAHIILNKNPYLNPHAWLYSLEKIAKKVSVACFLFGLIPVMITDHLNKPKLAKKMLISALAGVVGGQILSIILSDNSTIRLSPRGIYKEYPAAQKYQEAMCDLVAGELVGHEKCASLQREKLKHNGNRNGVENDHPYTTTRIWYHDKMAEAKKIWRQWSGKSK
jgi:hypothetical protein